LELAPIILAKGIREMPVIRYHPDWWVTLSLDGYGSHVNLDIANQIFTDHLLIWIVKEEADSFQTNQAYDQLQAKRDKARMRPLVDLVAKHVGVIHQFQLIAIMAQQALKKGQPEDWINYFISVNMHPKHRLPFDAWLRMIASCLQTLDAVFKTELGSMTIFDAMLNFWKAWTSELREEVVCNIAVLTKASLDLGDYIFGSKDNLTALQAYVPSTKLQQLCVAYMAAK
jgi:hypothetical protein